MTQENPVGKTKSQGWEMGVRRTLPVTEAEAWQMILEALGLDDIPYSKGTSFKNDEDTQIEIRSFQHGSLIRMKWQPEAWPNNSTLQIRVLPAKTGATISVHHEWLDDASQREAMKTYWTTLLETLKASVE